MKRWPRNSIGKRQHLFTSGELDHLFKYLDGASIRAIARDMGVSDTIVRKWLKRLGLLVRRNREHGTKVIPWSSPLRCQRCGILLQYAESQVDGLCDWCIERRERMSGKAQVDLQQAINEMESALAAHEDAVMVIGRDNA